ncbi:very short patch repair endonuclease [uncultured Thiohalocapsa sp.]|uniref:very short patch repair endonuclease n=1 Tax=uncultured Thiohalocapsa sp. TaxID=768990 RepID=UPI00345E066E
MHHTDVTDTRTPAQRRRIMQSVKRKDTGPELTVRRLLHRMGYRFCLHRRDLPGKPDIVLPRWKTVILVHGCFWHGHDCRYGRPPRSRTEYWVNKIETNRKRDARVAVALTQLGWRVATIWQCETTDTAHVARVLRAYLGDQ